MFYLAYLCLLVYSGVSFCFVLSSSRHSHAWKFQTIRTNINIYKYSFFPRTIILWNQLPPPVIAVPDLDAFKVAVKGVF